ncbi:hypothetical protein QFZ68_003807 [Streptomyces sp. V1I6]|nr:hypothetical protein [Streptomyces sp. V1I6]
MNRKPALAVVGATGAVGAVMLEILSQHADVWGEIRLAASPRSAGRKLAVRGEQCEVLPLEESVFDGIDVALFLVPGDVSERWAPVAVAKGAVVVDASPAFRAGPGRPAGRSRGQPACRTGAPARHRRRPARHHARHDPGRRRAACRVRAAGTGRLVLPGRQWRRT